MLQQKPNDNRWKNSNFVALDTSQAAQSINLSIEFYNWITNKDKK